MTISSTALHREGSISTMPPEFVLTDAHKSKFNQILNALGFEQGELIGKGNFASVFKCNNCVIKVSTKLD
jgi:hypothetical protein